MSPGRPKTGRRISKVITLKISPKQYDVICGGAEAEARSRGAMIRVMLMEGIKKRVRQGRIVVENIGLIPV